MKLLKKLFQWVTALPTFKFLFLLALFLLVNTFAIQQILNYQQSSTNSKQTDQLINFIITSGNQQITPLLENNQLEQIPSQIEKIVEYDLLQQLALYQQDGELISKSSSNPEDISQIYSKVANIEVNDKNFGYLIYGFHQLNRKSFTQNFWLYYPALGLWLFTCLIFLFKFKSSPGPTTKTQDAPAISYKKELQQLLKRSQSQEKAKTLLIINADWEAYNNKPRMPLISLLNKWTAHHKCHLISFESNQMVLGLPEPFKLDILKKIQILELCLKELGISTTLLIHSLEFGEPIYQHFFGIVEQGLWLESKEELGIDKDAMYIKRDIEIEVESYGVFHLLLIDALKAEDATYIERQSRFFLQ